MRFDGFPTTLFIDGVAYKMATGKIIFHAGNVALVPLGQRFGRKMPKISDRGTL